MKLKTALLALAMSSTITAAVNPAFANSKASDNTLHQYGSPLSLLNKVYEGDITAAQMVELGDTGLGTANAMAGELVALDGVVYAINADGSIAEAPADLKAPYMGMLTFEASDTVEIDGAHSIQDLQSKLAAKMGSENSFYAFKIHGTFPYLKMASAHKIEDENMALMDYLATRLMYEKENVTGTLVGLYTPGYLGNVSIPGLHFHFLSDKHDLGGHVEDLRFDQQTIQMQEINQINVSLPKVPKFRKQKLDMTPAPAATKAAE